MDNLFFPWNNFIPRLVMMVKIKTNLLFRQILDMANRSENRILVSEVFIYRSCL